MILTNEQTAEADALLTSVLQESVQRLDYKDRRLIKARLREFDCENMRDVWRTFTNTPTHNTSHTVDNVEMFVTWPSNVIESNHLTCKSKAYQLKTHPGKVMRIRAKLKKGAASQYANRVTRGGYTFYTDSKGSFEARVAVELDGSYSVYARYMPNTPSKEQ